MKLALAILASLAVVTGVVIMIVTAVVDIVIDFDLAEDEEDYE